MGLLGKLPDVDKLSAMFDEDFAVLTTKLEAILQEIKGLRSDLTTAGPAAAAAAPPPQPGAPGS